MSVPQGRHGYVTIGGTSYPVLNWAMPHPRNLVQGIPVGSSWATNQAEGLRTSRFVAEMMVRSKATEVLALAFWNLFLSRTFSGVNDNVAASTIVAGSGRKTYTLTSARAEAFVLKVRKGLPVGLSVVFVAPGLPTRADYTPTDYSQTIDNSPPLMFDAATFTGVTGGVYGFDLSYSNNHLPDAPLDGTKLVSEWDAGPITCSASIRVKEFAEASVPFADAANITLALAGSATRSFSLTSVTPENPHDPAVDTGQVFKNWACLVQGSTSTKPLVVT